jgi:hypothetical protein
MGVPTSEVGYTSATTEKGDHEVHKGHVVALAKKTFSSSSNNNVKKHYSGRGGSPGFFLGREFNKFN